MTDENRRDNALLELETFVRTGILPRELSKDLAGLQRYREQADYGGSFRFDESTGAEEVERAARMVEAARSLLATRGLVR